MILLLHLTLAFTSIVFAGVAYAKPSSTHLNISYGLIAGTLASGVLLMAGSTTHLMEATVSGLLYLSFVTVATVAAKRKALATE